MENLMIIVTNREVLHLQSTILMSMTHLHNYSHKFHKFHKFNKCNKKLICWIQMNLLFSQFNNHSNQYNQHKQFNQFNLSLINHKLQNQPILESHLLKCCQLVLQVVKQRLQDCKLKQHFRRMETKLFWISLYRIRVLKFNFK